MRGAQHTPGPWAADAEEMAQGADDIFTIGIWGPGADGDRTLIGTISAFSLLSETHGGVEYVTTDAPSMDKLGEAKANARLIAAAPELLSLLQDAVASFGPHLEGGDNEWLTFANAAIAKATGAAT